MRQKVAIYRFVMVIITRKQEYLAHYSFTSQPNQTCERFSNILKMIFTVTIAILLITPAPSLQLNIISCVDSSRPSSISSWKSSVVAKVTQANGSSVYTYEGPTGTSGAEVSLKYSERLRATPLVKHYVFAEYTNESPRRLVLQPVKNGKTGDFVLLEGDSGSGGGDWNVVVEQIDVMKGEPSITGIMKKPQSMSFRKLAIFTLNPTDSVTTATTKLKETSCRDLDIPITQPPLALRQTTSRPRSPVTCPPTPSKQTADASCSVCPECRCVCNCNCKDC